VSELRQDPTTKEWVIIATERRKRPSDFLHQEATAEKPSSVSSCPFCPGNENMTPDKILSFPDSDTGPWRVRVIGNKFPAVAPNGDTARQVEQGCFLKMNGVGVHEVVVESPRHNMTLALMNDSQVTEVLLAHQQRYNVLAQLPYIKSLIIYKNHGRNAGTTLDHPHSQIVGTAIVPRHMRTQYEVAISYYDDHGSCLYSDLTERELEAGTRIVMESNGFVVFHPFASRRPFETWIMPRAQQDSFGEASEEEIQQLACVLRTTLLKLYRALDNPDFNLVISSAPIGEERADFYQWNLRIIPRITQPAGFEVGSGIYINPALPEETAKFMRDLQI